MAETKPSVKRGPMVLTLAMAAALAASFATHEDTAYVPYRDKSGGVLTVCGGITGPDVVEGKTYSFAECRTLQDRFIARFNGALQRCVRVPVSAYEHFAFLHFAWNIGHQAFCKSTLVRLLNQSDYTGACAQMSRWVFDNGKDCRIKSNRCRGIVLRRVMERAMCDGNLAIPGVFH
ncbi:MAG: lysozyme [Pseudomonadota bacterium]|nr:lysozyme [Pseudomonadota bacterium]